MPEQDSISRLSADFTAGPKWHDEDTDREYLSHMDEFEREGTYKNLVDAAIIQRIKARIAMNRAKQLLQQYDSGTGTSYRDILAARLARFREYEHIPFPSQKKAAAVSATQDEPVTVSSFDTGYLPKDMKALQDAYLFSIEADGEELDATERRTLAKAMKEAASRRPWWAYVIKKGHTPVGGAWLDRWARYGTGRKQLSGVEITGLGIYKRHREHGVGTRAVKLLAAAAAQHARNYRLPYVLIGYTEANQRAGKLYRRLGFGHPYKDSTGIILRMTPDQAEALAKQASAPGLPDRSDYGDFSSLGEDTLATLVRQRHDAERARTHEDMRIGGPGGLHSWAVPKFMPEKPGDKRLAIEQPVHQWTYKDFQGRLNHGYGKGNVTKMEESPVVILKNTGNHIMFTRGDSKDAPIYQLIRTKDRDWLLFIKAKDQPVQVRKYPKEHFKQVPVDQLPELIANGASISRKIDGAGMLAYLGKHGVEAYGIRANAQGDKPEYTDIIGNLRSIQVPKDLQGTLLRGEVFGMRGNRSIPANELSGILNSTIRNAAYKKRGDGIRLLIAGLAVHDNGKDDYDQEKVNSIISRLGTDAIVPMRRYSGKDALAAIVAMRRGQDKLTHEGFVVHVPGKRPLKAKFKEDADVVVRNVFKADTDADNRAGGFEYSLPGSDKVIGRVGTGFDYATLRDMLTNPDNYIGRTARIQSQEQYPSGAYRAPSFIAMKED